MDGIRLYAVEPSTSSPTRELRSNGPSFADEFGKALGSVEGLQVAADREVEKVALGGGNLHETALALEKADIGMRVMTKVRNKLVDAYQEIMRMSV
jgi:flagellar hook-basal body complex protein FliE